MAELTRRRVLTLGTVTLLGATPMAAGCSFFSMEPGDDGKDGPNGGGNGVDTEAKESPMLAKQVEEGALPALAERLPAKPLTVQPVEELGRYGGTIRTGELDQNRAGIGDYSSVGLVEWTKATPPEPTEGLAERFEASEDFRTFEFVLRKGLRWSDGELFTTSDIEFWYEHVLQNEEITPAFPSWLQSGGKVKLEFPDELTVRFIFPEPHSLFLRYLCFPSVGGTLWVPKHYVSKFHPVASDKKKVEAQAKKAGFDTWLNYWADRTNSWLNPDLPVLGAWRISKPASAGSNAEAERNPYFWKVDTEGRQLPYVDKVTWIFLEQEPLTLRAANGDLDVAITQIGYDAVPLLLKNAEEKKFRVLRWGLDGSYNSVHVNQSHPDPILRALYQNRDFRAGLSHAINREEINEALLAGQGLVSHPCGSPGDTYYKEGYGQRFIAYDPDKANQLLDQAGLTKKDSDGFRVRPDGKPLLLTTLTYPAGLAVPEVTALEYAKRYWAQVGVNMRVRNVSRELFYEEVPLGKYDLCGYSAAGYLWDIDPLWYVPTSTSTYWAPLYGAHVASGGAEGMKPIGVYADLIDTYNEMLTSTDDNQRLAKGQRILQIHDENVFIIGLCRIPFQPAVASNKLGNMREDAISSFRAGILAATEPAQLFLRQD